VLTVVLGFSLSMPAAPTFVLRASAGKQTPRTFPDQRLVTPVNDRPAGPYTRVHPWSELPYDADVYDNRASVIGIAEGPDRNIYVLTRCNRNSCEGRSEAPILKFDPEGRLLGSFGVGLFVFPHNLTIDRQGHVWTTDEGNHAVRKFTADGTLLMTIGEPGKAGGPPSLLTSPTGVLVAPDGNIFVTEGHDNSPKAAVARVSKWTADGKFIKTWGRTGSAPGEFSTPHVMAMDSRGRLFVGDRNNNRIQIFDQEGNFLDLWHQFGRPSGIVITPDDRIYVADSESFDFHNPGWEKGIRIGSARDGSVEYFIRDLEPMTISHSGAEGIGVDSRGNIYGGVVRRRMLEKFVRTGSGAAPSPAKPSAAPRSAVAKALAGQGEALTHLGHITTAFGQSGGLAVTAAIEVNAAMYHANLAAGQPGLDLMKLHTVHVLDVLPSVANAAAAVATHIELAMKAGDASPVIRKLGPTIAASARAVAARAQAMRTLASQALAASSFEAMTPLVQQLRAMALTLDTEGLNPLEAAVYAILEGERLPRVLR
jgi:DNA-binding beta-propeller fold protein YncE